MADIKGVAELFGMNVGEFAEFTGYSRQELHRVLDNGKAVGTARMADTIRKLDAASYDMYSAAVSQAENSKRSREEYEGILLFIPDDIFNEHFVKLEKYKQYYQLGDVIKINANGNLSEYIIEDITDDRHYVTLHLEQN